MVTISVIVNHMIFTSETLNEPFCIFIPAYKEISNSQLNKILKISELASLSMSCVGLLKMKSTKVSHERKCWNTNS